MNIRNVFIKDYDKIKILFKRHNMNMIDFKRWVNLWKKTCEKKLMNHLSVFYNLASKLFN